MTTVEADASLSQQGHYAGAVTRLAAFVVDQAVSATSFAAGTAVVAWVLALVSSDRVDIHLGAAGVGLLYAVWAFAYLAYPWAVSGKTPGMALMGIRVVRADGDDAGGRRAAVRAITLPLGFLTLGLGFAPIVLGRRRRALHDVLAGTVVVYAWDARAARWRFLARRNEGGAAGAG
ncbi:MAG: RDD family protein [Acidimicrobiia bacterium]|nr:RDD family protein [Acidimicrobiia bacterium]